MKIVHNRTKEDLDILYNDSALTFEGCTLDEDNLLWLVDWLNHNDAGFIGEPTFYVTSGELMNDIYHLTGTNAYPYDLNIVSIKLDDLSDFRGIIIERFKLGGRWFDDIVENNARREVED